MKNVQNTKISEKRITVREALRLLWLWLVPAMIALAGTLGCAKVEGSGRTQFVVVSQSQERKLGIQAYEEVLKNEKLSDDTTMTAVLNRVGKRIAAAGDELLADKDMSEFEWEFNLIESDQINAFCLPGGKIAVYTGILPVMKTEAGMAVVVGHEVAHAIQRHGAERMSQQLAVGTIAKIASVGLKDASGATRDTAMAALGLGANVGVLLPFSRTHESEADALGLMLAAEAGYDPREAVPLWERMAEIGGEKPPEFMSTHPHEANRIQKLNSLMPEAMERYEVAPEKYGLGQTL